MEYLIENADIKNKNLLKICIDKGNKDLYALQNISEDTTFYDTLLNIGLKTDVAKNFDPFTHKITDNQAGAFRLKERYNECSESTKNWFNDTKKIEDTRLKASNDQSLNGSNSDSGYDVESDID
jgi:hypothetical protein